MPNYNIETHQKNADIKLFWYEQCFASKWTLIIEVRVIFVIITIRSFDDSAE